MATITIGGKEHDIPQVASFDMDEAQLLFEYTGLTIEDFAPDQDDGEMSDQRLEEILGRVKNPGFLRTLMHVAYRRGNSRVPDTRIRQVIGRENFADRYVEYVQAIDEDDTAGDGSPPAQESTSTPTESSGSELVDSSESSGGVSTNGSAQPDSHLEPTGTSRSDTSSPVSDLAT